MLRRTLVYFRLCFGFRSTGISICFQNHEEGKVIVIKIMLQSYFEVFISISFS